MPKKGPKPPKPKKHHKHSTKDTHDKNTACAFLDEEICIEAKVTVNPDVSVGEIEVKCLESTIDPSSKHKNASDECTMIVSQLIRVKIPVHFKANVKAEKHGVSCGDHSDESSSCLDDHK
ncbi:hypothetical protein [Sporosarcina ureilytica]|uniref:Uncharacterized protein n=1 Tax=Sporosarcina ureilytica TaxID=298596 RepID=A0A1D8JCW8_9BACL|nr:hypothetical protein [Sporosarcina ureilytica]AOV06553.1 hypothetical protein BI350_02285 [Sporosarcina ureilytica]